jgi:hypothetical protein
VDGTRTREDDTVGSESFTIGTDEPSPTVPTVDDKCPIDRALTKPVTKLGSVSGEVEAALARALDAAATAGRFDVVAQIAGELQARRLAAAGVPSLPSKRTVQ